MQITHNRRSGKIRLKCRERLNKRLEAGLARISRALARQRCRTRRAASELRDRVEVWVNEGGAEADVRR
jgi:hypothetical protein